MRNAAKNGPCTTGQRRPTNTRSNRRPAQYRNRADHAAGNRYHCQAAFKAQSRDDDKPGEQRAGDASCRIERNGLRSQLEGGWEVTADPRMDLRIRDGRRELLRNPEHYDLITLEPPPPSSAGVVNLYSRDFYALAASRLNPNGLFAQWLPLSTNPPLVSADAEFLAALEHERTVLLSFYEAGIYAYQGDEGRWQETMTWVLRKDPDNPYYRWFVCNDVLE